MMDFVGVSAEDVAHLQLKMVDSRICSVAVVNMLVSDWISTGRMRVQQLVRRVISAFFSFQAS